jgi:hypothetical protein
MRSHRYESKIDNTTGSVENETMMYKHNNHHHHSPSIKVTMLKQFYLMPQKNNIRYKNTN